MADCQEKLYYLLLFHCYIFALLYVKKMITLHRVLPTFGAPTFSCCLYFIRSQVLNLISTQQLNLFRQLQFLFGFQVDSSDGFEKIEHTGLMLLSSFSLHTV